jgi:membrane protease YdiL (CAAX protease family)
MNLNNKTLSDFADSLSRMSRTRFVMIVLFAAIITSEAVGTVLYQAVLNHQILDNLYGGKSLWAMIVYCLAVPVLEILVFVATPYKLAQNSAFLRNNLLYVMLFSSLVFALIHVMFESNFLILLHIFLSCFIWFFAYVSRIEKDRKAFWLVLLTNVIFKFVVVLGEML